MIYWTLDSIPELALLPKDERRPLWLSYYWKIFRTRFAPWTGLIAVMAFSQIGRSFDESLGHIIGGAIGGFLFWQVIMETIHSYIKEDTKVDEYNGEKDVK